ncbi:acetolactate synthase [Thermostilla marina]
MSSDSIPPVSLPTAQGRRYPTLRQFTVFLENRVGQLLELVRRFESNRVPIVALSVVDTCECAFVRFLPADPEKGREILERAGLAIVESDLIAVELPDSPQPLAEICTALLRAEINIVQAYPLMVRSHGRPVVALMVDQLDLALETLAESKFVILGETDLNADSPGA